MNTIRNSFSVLICFFFAGALWAQEIKWFGQSPEMMAAVEGRGWEDVGFNRLPASAEGVVRAPVWDLSRQTAGLMLRFKTNSSEIHVSYTPTGNLQMPHMPATGVSGVDLYTKGKAGNWLWIRGGYKFGEKVTYDFALDLNADENKEYFLFLPLYNGLRDLEIGVPSDKNFAFVPKRTERPILVYGTSIAQGACASRAGMAWTNILARDLDMPMINLGFSGNGKMEPEVIDLITQIDPAVFVLDCLPNLGAFNEDEVKGKLIFAVQTIRSIYPDIPILLTEHAGYSDGLVFEPRAEIYQNLNRWLQESFQSLQDSSVTGVYTLTKDEIGMGVDDFVDGTHPSDLGMVKYAEAYDKKLRMILSKTSHSK